MKHTGCDSNQLCYLSNIVGATVCQKTPLLDSKRKYLYEEVKAHWEIPLAYTNMRSRMLEDIISILHKSRLVYWQCLCIHGRAIEPPALQSYSDSYGFIHSASQLVVETNISRNHYSRFI